MPKQNSTNAFLQTMLRVIDHPLFGVPGSSEEERQLLQFNAFVEVLRMARPQLKQLAAFWGVALAAIETKAQYGHLPPDERIRLAEPRILRLLRDNMFASLENELAGLGALKEGAPKKRRRSPQDSNLIKDVESIMERRKVSVRSACSHLAKKHGRTEEAIRKSYERALKRHS